MPAYRYTVRRGATDRGQIAVASGSNEAQSETISINIDMTTMSRNEAVMLIDKAKAKILAEPWPPL